MNPDAHPGGPLSARARAATLTLAALALLGFAVAIFADHIASYYLLQWAPTLKRYPTQEEREAVRQALTLDRAVHAAMWLALAASLFAWRCANGRCEAAPAPARACTWLVLGMASYAVLRVVVESQLAIHLVRVPNVASGVGWHGPGYALAGVALLLATLFAAGFARPARAAARRVVR